jgi:hypothetical protein
VGLGECQLRSDRRKITVLALGCTENARDIFFLVIAFVVTEIGTLLHPCPSEEKEVREAVQWTTKHSLVMRQVWALSNLLTGHAKLPWSLTTFFITVT